MVGAILVAAMAGAGYSSAAQCAPVELGVGVCHNGIPVEWSAGVMKPHMHENGGYYASADDLAKTLGVKVDIAADNRSVTVNGKSVTAAAVGAKGIHEHEHRVFAPIKEFAEAAGFKADVDTQKHTVNLRD
jgi:hypothetical protein